MKNFDAFKQHGDVIWNIANLLRGPYRPPQYRRVMIPLTVLRRLDCVLEKSKAQVIAMHKQLKAETKIKAFCAVYFKPRRKESVHDQAQMSGVLDQAVERFKERPEEERDEVKTLLVNFRNLYGFLSQVIPYQDSDLEQLYTYLRFLLTKLPKRDSGPGAHLEDEIELQYYRLQKISEGQIDLNTGDGHPLKGPSDVGTGQEDQKIKLSELIDILNERFGTNFTQADQLFFDQIQEEATEDDALKKAAATNSKEDFRYVFEKAFEGLVIDRMDGNEEIFGKLMSDGEFRKLAVEHLLHKVYCALKNPKDDATYPSGGVALGKGGAGVVKWAA